MKNLRPVDKLIGVLFIAFLIFVAGWLYGNQDFYSIGRGMCSDVWNPRSLINRSDSEYATACSQGAAARRDQMFFVGFVLFVLFSIGFLAISNSQTDEAEV